jgi:Ca2+-binding RTX toxin-like protein
MSRFTRAALGAVLVAVALPAAANAATVDVAADNTITYRAATGETNSLLVRESAGSRALELVDSAGLTSRSPLCASVTLTTVRCALGFDRVDARLGDRDDSASIRVSGPVVIDGGDGQDLFFAGMAPGASRVDYRGGLRPDTISYASSSAGATMTQDDVANDGRPSRGDRDTVRRDVEHVIGSPFDDVIEASRTGLIQSFPSGNGASFPQQLAGGAGNDVVRGGTNMDFHFMGGGVDGRDTILAGSNFSIVDYGGRAFGVTVSLQSGANDGVPGEGDDIQGSVEQLVGGRGGDTLLALPTSSLSHHLIGGDGIDTLEGGKGNDVLDGGKAEDTMNANGGDDFIDADDGVGEIINCGAGTDTAEADSLDGFFACETRRVGVLRLTPKSVRAEAGKVVRMRLAWRHPKAWKQLRTIELRLTQGGAPVGEVAVRPRGGKVAGDGGVAVKRARIVSRGRTVVAKLALRLDESLAGQTLKAEVEATDRRGARQLERDAGTVRVAR